MYKTRIGTFLNVEKIGQARRLKTNRLKCNRPLEFTKIFNYSIDEKSSLKIIRYIRLMSCRLILL